MGYVVHFIPCDGALGAHHQRHTHVRLMVIAVDLKLADYEQEGRTGMVLR